MEAQRAALPAGSRDLPILLLRLANADAELIAAVAARPDSAEGTRRAREAAIRYLTEVSAGIQRLDYRLSLPGG